MPEIIPFRAYRYNSKRFRTLRKVLSPPYDVISRKEQEALYCRSPYNFVRLDLGKKKAGVDVYREAAVDLKTWIEEEVFFKEKQSAIYVYAQVYRDPEGRKRRRVGFMSLVRMEPRKVKKHETTLSAPKEDRSRLLESLGAHLSPIFAFFDDPRGRVHSEVLKSTRRRPVVDVMIDEVRHQLFVEKDAKRIDRIARFLKPKSMYIADGHHRFEVAYGYYQLQKRRRSSQKKEAAYVLTYLCAAQPNQMLIYPTHRVLCLSAGWEIPFARRCRKHFLIHECGSAAELLALMKRQGRSKHLIACAYRESLRSRGKKRIHFALLEPKKKTSDLDVMIAHKFLVLPLLGTKDVKRSRKVSFTREPGEALTLLEEGKAQVAIFLSGIPIEEIMRVSNAGLRLPQKSTYFYPKLLSGLVFHKFA